MHVASLHVAAQVKRVHDRCFHYDMLRCRFCSQVSLDHKSPHFSSPPVPVAVSRVCVRGEAGGVQLKRCVVCVAQAEQSLQQVAAYWYGTDWIQLWGINPEITVPDRCLLSVCISSFRV